MAAENKKEFIAKNVASMLRDGDFVNLGAGLPGLASKHLPPGIKVMFHVENGAIGQLEELPFEWDWNDKQSAID